MHRAARVGSRFFLLLASLPALAQTHAITNARLVPVTAPAIERGTIVIKDGKIVAVGAKVTVPTGANKIDGTGLSVYPGWIDAYTTLGLAEISSVRGSVDTAEVGLFNPQAQAWIAVNPHSEMVRTARANGITSALVAPSGGRISGTASAVNLFGNYPNEMALATQVGVVLNIPSRYRRSVRGSGETPAEGGDSGADRVAEDLAKLKQYLREAKAYAEMRARQEKSGGPAAVRDNALEAMIPIMRGQRPVLVPADHFREIRAALELAAEFGLKIMISGGADAWKVADLLKQKDVPVIYTYVENLPRLPEDPYDAPFSTPSALRKAGVRFAIATGSAGGARNLPYQAALAAAYGLEREDALKAITLWPAELLGVADRVGSLDVGKLANLLVSKGDPLDVRAEIRYVFVDGKPVPLESRNSELYEKFLR